MVKLAALLSLIAWGLLTFVVISAAPGNADAKVLYFVGAVAGTAVISSTLALAIPRIYLLCYLWILSSLFALWFLPAFFLAEASPVERLSMMLIVCSAAAWPFALRRHYQQRMEDV